MTLRPRPALVLLIVLAACGGASPEGQLEEARSHLASGDYAAASAAAEVGLAAGAQGATAWRLELAALEGEARQARGDEALARLERLNETWSDQVTGALYVQTAAQVKEGGDAQGAIGVLDAGAQRFPEDGSIARAIEQLGASGSDEEIERLRSLGYVE